MRTNHWHACVGITTLAAQFVLSTASFAATVPSGFVDSTYVEVPTNVTAMQFSPDGRLFVSQQSGKLRVVQNGNLLTTPFLTLPVDASGERGLLGVAFDPGFATNNFVYVYYTAKTPTIHNRLSRFTANGNVAVPGSEVVLLDLNPLSFAKNHNGGAIHFGNDGKLYIAVGDNANGDNAQTLGNLLGQDPADQSRRIHPDGQSVLRKHLRRQSLDLGTWAAQSVYHCISAEHWPLVHQRCRAKYLGGNQRRKCRRQLRLARY